jgi:hypothetical protein
MNVQEFCDVLKARLCPRVYRKSVEAIGSFRLLLTRTLLLSRYALAVYERDRSADGASQLRRARREVASALWAFPALGEVGLYLVWCGPRAKWAPHVGSMPADRTGLHLVIVQGVHFLDLETGERALNQSAWGPVRFGGVDSVAAQVEAVLA